MDGQGCRDGTFFMQAELEQIKCGVLTHMDQSLY